MRERASSNSSSTTPADGSTSTCRCARRPAAAIEPGDPFSTAVFHSLTFAEEESLLGELRAWNQRAGRARLPRHHVAGRRRRSRPQPGARPRLRPPRAASTRRRARHELFSVTTRSSPRRRAVRHDAAASSEFVAPLLRTAMSTAASSSPSHPPAPTSLRSAAAPFATATSGSSTGRRYGARAPSSLSGASSSPEPTRTRPSIEGSPRSSCPWTCEGSRCARSGR